LPNARVSVPARERAEGATRWLGSSTRRGHADATQRGACNPESTVTFLLTHRRQAPQPTADGAVCSLSPPTQLNWASLSLSIAVVLAAVGAGLCVSAKFPERRSFIFRLGNVAGVILISTGIFYSSQCVPTPPYKSTAEQVFRESCVPPNQPCHKPIKGVKGFKGHLKSIPGWFKRN
jgi:hypothetical protein